MILSGKCYPQAVKCLKLINVDVALGENLSVDKDGKMIQVGLTRRNLRVKIST